MGWSGTVFNFAETFMKKSSTYGKNTPPILGQNSKLFGSYGPLKSGLDPFLGMPHLHAIQFQTFFRAENTLGTVGIFSIVPLFPVKL